MPVHTGCVVIELESVDEEHIVKYLHGHVYSYNWILKNDEESSKVLVCVWWREEDHKQFSTTPLRSFIKRLKNKTTYNSIRISGKMSTEEGVQTVCKGVRGSITKYYLEPHLRLYLSDWSSVNPAEIGELPSDRINPNTKCNLILKTVDTMDISDKFYLLQKIMASIIPHAKQLSEVEKLSQVNENVPSPIDC